MLHWLVLTLAALGVLLFAEARRISWLKVVSKTITSTGFILFAVSAGATATFFGRFILAGLVLSWFGDVFLLSRREQLFQAGLVSFLLAHVAYCTSFVVRGISVSSAAGTLVLIVLVAIFVLRWIFPHVPPNMKSPVAAYIIVISTMVTLAGGTFGAHGNYAILFGAVTFYLSDISVARDRFVSPGYQNALWGLPLYYGGQLLLAYSTSFG